MNTTKGSWRRPKSISQEEYESNWDAIFKKKRFIMHYNPRLPHQVKHADALEQSGMVDIIPSKERQGDQIPIVSGPWFAKFPVQIMIDRAYWGDPENITLSVVTPHGRYWPQPTERKETPELWPWKKVNTTALVLADYGQDVSHIVKCAKKYFDVVRVRNHPASGENEIESLTSAICLSGVVIGSKTTALVEAAIMGRPVIALGPDSPCGSISSTWDNLVFPDRDAWLQELAARQFNHEELANGHALEIIENVYHQALADYRDRSAG